MNALILNGTPRKNGNTAALTESIIETLKDSGVDVKERFLYQMKIAGCSNCGSCKKNAKQAPCSIKDDAIELMKEFEENDIIILASPIYMWSLTGCLNAFKERLHCLCNDDHTENKMSKKKIALALTMADDEFVASAAVTSVVHFCEFFDINYSGTIAIPFASKEQVARPLYKEKVKDFVKGLI